MRYYETIYIINPDFEDSRLDEIKSNVENQIKKECEEIVNSYIWGKRRLAYNIKNINYGTYIITHYSAKKINVKELNSWMEIQENVLAHMTVRLDESPVLREKNKDSKKDEDDNSALFYPVNDVDNVKKHLIKYLK